MYSKDYFETNKLSGTREKGYMQPELELVRQWMERAKVDLRSAQADLAAELVGFRHASLQHLEACFVGEPMGGNEICHGALGDPRS